MNLKHEITTLSNNKLADGLASGRFSGGVSRLELGEEVLIRYNPYAGVEKWLKYRFSAWSEAKAWLVVTLGVLFFSFGGPGFVLQAIVFVLMGHVSPQAAAAAAAANQTMLWLMLLVLAGLSCVVWLRYISQPSHIGLGADGIRLYWRHIPGAYAGPKIAWDTIRHVYLKRPAGKTSLQDYWICFQQSCGKSLALKLGAIATMDERAKLLEAINSWAPKMTRDPDVLEVLSPPQDHSYTELWLQALSAPPKRERLTPLSGSATLQDGRYVICGQLGVGGQGTAYLAQERKADSKGTLIDQEGTIVLKESILPVYVDVSVRKQALEKFQNEAAMLRRLNHPQVVQLRDFFVEDHRSYLVLEHIDGLSLRCLVEDCGRQLEDKVRGLALQMCEILSYLHCLVPPVVHRDFTPDNLIAGTDGILKLVDFNVAHQSESTATGTVVGKHAYIPPEQFRGKPTIQSDIYAMGATLFYLLTGEDPEPISTSYPLLHVHDVSPALNEIVARATNIDAKIRYGTVEQLQADLES